MSFNPYEELGIEPGASAEEVDKAFRERAKETHPDKGGDSEEFQRAKRAVAILRNPKKRKHYDETGDSGGEKAEQHPDFHALTYIGQLVAQMCRQPALEKCMHMDLAEKLVEGAEKDRDTISEQIAKAKETIARAEKLKGRFKRTTEGTNLIEDGIDFFLRTAEQEIREFEKTRAKIERAIEILEGFEFEADEDPTVAILRQLDTYEPGQMRYVSFGY